MKTIGTGSNGFSHKLKLLRSSEVHIWYAFLDRPQLIEYFRNHEDLLNTSETEKLKTYLNRASGELYHLTRVFIRILLSHYSPSIAPKDWHFKANQWGKPEIGNHLRKPIYFNLAHTDGLIVCAISGHPNIGVDAENMRHKFDYLKFSQKSFSTQETEALKKLPPGRQAEFFFRTWTLKEAYAKARGIGLSIPLQKLSFSTAKGEKRKVEVEFDTGIQDEPKAWQFAVSQPTKNHVVSLAIKRLASRSVQVVEKDFLALVRKERK